MSGHSKWATIKRKKAKTDAQRGKVFTKILREITTAVKQAGSDPEGNARLRLAILKAKENNVPADNIKRSIEKASGTGDGGSLEEVSYEGYGPAGVAILAQAITDNRNRTVSEVRYIFSKNGGNMGESGCVGWMFDRRGVIVFNKTADNEEKLSMEAIELGAEDIELDDSLLSVITSPESIEKVKEGLEGKGFIVESSEVEMRPKTMVKIEKDEARKVLNLISALEDHDDIQNVYANFDISEEDLNAINS